jgi:hypothetical protein
MIPRFSTWIEIAVASQNNRKEGKDLDEIVAKKLAELAEEIELAGNGNRQEIYQSLKRVMAAVPQEKEQDQQPTDPQNSGQEAPPEQPQVQAQQDPMAKTMQVLK